MKAAWWLKVLALLFVHGASVVLLVRGARGLPGWQIPLAMVAGHLTLDAVTLLVHFVLDNYFSPRTPLLGEVVYYFREHHTKPMAMFGRGYVDNNFENALIGLAWQLVALPLANPFFDVLVGTGAIGSAYITLIHRWAHQDDPGALGRLLQRCRLVVSREHHDLHHQGQGRNYGLAAGWLDHLAESLHLFELIEWTVHRATGIRPVHARLSDEPTSARGHS